MDFSNMGIFARDDRIPDITEPWPVKDVSRLSSVNMRVLMIRRLSMSPLSAH